MIKYFKPQLNYKEQKAVKKVIKSGYLTSGKKVIELENLFREATNKKYAIAVNSCSAGLFLAVKTIFNKKIKEVVTTPLSFIATTEAIEQNNYIPKYYDIDLETLNIKEPKEKENILPVCFGGIPIFFDKKRMVVDAAHMSPYKLPNYETAVFSLYANKIYTSGEGGMIVTDNEEAAEKMILLRHHGAKKTNKSYDYDIVIDGYKMIMSDLHAAIGVEQIKKRKKIEKTREEIAQDYFEGFKNVEEINTLKYNKNNSYHLFQIFVKSMTGEKLRKKLLKKNIETSLHYKPIPLFSKYDIKQNFPNAFMVYKQSVSLPIYPSLKKREIKKVINSVKEIVNERNLY